MRRAIAVVTLGLVGAFPASGAASGFDLRLGGFIPRAESNLFADDAELYTVQKSDWRGVSGGFEFSMRLARNVEMGFHLDGYGRTIPTSYRDFVTESGREIRQSLRLNIVPMGVTFRLVPTRRHARLAPYAAAGVDLYFWKYEEFGDFIDFDDPGKRIIEDSFISEGATPGFHVAGGLRVPLNHDVSIVGEARYQVAQKAKMGDDFRGNELDLTGASVTLGIHVGF